MSRPSATQSPSASSSRCFWTIASRTLGLAATREAPSETSGVRMASVTSRSLSSTRSPAKAMSSEAGSTVGPARATLRYIAPESRYVKPSAFASARATVDFPAPAGPSIATTI